MMNAAKARYRVWPLTVSVRMLIPVSLAGFLYACGERAQDTAAPVNSPATASLDVAGSSSVATGTMEKGVYFQPSLAGYTLQNEYDDDGDGDGVNETRVRRYINGTGDTAFSMSTGGKLWAWSLDTKGDDDSDIHENYVVRNSDCDKVFDERYSLDAQFHVPDCLVEGGVAEQRRLSPY